MIVHSHSHNANIAAALLGAGSMGMLAGAYGTEPRFKPQPRAKKLKKLSTRERMAKASRKRNRR